MAMLNKCISNSNFLFLVKNFSAQSSFVIAVLHYMYSLPCSRIGFQSIERPSFTLTKTVTVYRNLRPLNRLDSQDMQIVLLQQTKK